MMYLFTPTAMINVDAYVKIYMEGESIQGMLTNGKVNVLYMGSREDCEKRFAALCLAKRSECSRDDSSVDDFLIYRR